MAAPSYTTSPNQVGDPRLASGSPGIDAGSGGLSTTASDLDGAVRIQGNGIDMGCYENE